MNNNQSIVGQSVICNGMGIGEIVDIVPLSEGGEKFYKVSFAKDKCINYFSITNKSNYRVLASRKILIEAIKEFNSKFDEVEYKTTQEKINMQKEMLKEEDIVKLAKTLSILNSEKQLHAQISKAFKDSLSTFVDELAFVLEIKRTEAYSMLNLKVPVAKDKK
jgi:RNA polymerase-interacting CarD/CdnL/TRCF family regulator